MDLTKYLEAGDLEGAIAAVEKEFKKYEEDSHVSRARHTLAVATKEYMDALGLPHDTIEKIEADFKAEEAKYKKAANLKKAFMDGDEIRKFVNSLK